MEGQEWYAQIRQAKQMAIDNHSRMPVIITYKQFHYAGLVFRGAKGGKRHYASSLAKFLLPAADEKQREGGHDSLAYCEDMKENDTMTEEK